MATETLKIVIDTVYRGAQNAQRAERDLENVGDAAGSSAGRMQRLAAVSGTVTAGLGALAVVARQTYAAVEEGARLQNVERQFNALSRSIDTTSDALMGDLRTATRGMIDDFSLMESANQIMNLGLADSHDDVVRLARVVGELGWNMDQVTLTIANQSTMRLDSLGLSIENVQTKAAALEEQGYATDEAFRLAIIEAGEEKILQVGSAADTTAGSLNRLTATLDNATNAFQVGTASGAAPFIAAIDEMSIKLGFSGLAGAVETVGAGFTQGLLGPLNMVSLAMQAAEDRTGALNGVLLSMMGPLGTNIALWQQLNAEIERFNGGATPDAKGGKQPYYPPPPGQAGETYEYATGTSYHPGGMATVGEFGPERISLPAGARVTSTNVTHNDNRRMTLTNSRGVQRVVSSYLRNRSRRSRAV